VDDSLRKLERTWQESGNYQDYFAYRNALLRAGQPEKAGFQVGDIVLVEEVESPWVKEPWEAELMRLGEEGDFNARPLKTENPYRVKPSAEYLAKGLYMTRADKKTLIRPVDPDKYEALAPVRAEHAKQDAEMRAQRAEAEKRRAEQEAARAPEASTQGEAPSAS
jgi:hypothetical protein